MATILQRHVLELQANRDNLEGVGEVPAPNPTPPRVHRCLWEQMAGDMERMLRGEVWAMPHGLPTDPSLIGLRLVTSLLSSEYAGLDPASSPIAAALVAALGKNLLQGLHPNGRSEAFVVMACSLLPVIHGLPCARVLRTELLLTLMQLQLRLLIAQPTAHPVLRLHSLRSLECLLHQERAAHGLLLYGDLSTHRPRAWNAIAQALSAPILHRGSIGDGVAQLQESRLRVRICKAVLGQLSLCGELGKAGTEVFGEESISNATSAEGAAATEQKTQHNEVAAAIKLRDAIESAARAMETEGAKAAVSSFQTAGLLAPDNSGRGEGGTHAGGGQERQPLFCSLEWESQFGERLGQLLFEAGEFSPREVGELLTRPEKAYGAALAAFLRRFDFASLSLTDALRLLFAGLRCPGEAQKIDRLMEAFAVRYYGNGRPPFTCADDVYTTAFSVMMLNVDLHNPAVRTKMTRDQFVTNTRRAAKTLPAGFLISLYDEVAASELKAHDGPVRSVRAPDSPASMVTGSSAALNPATIHEPLSEWRWRYLRIRHGVLEGVDAKEHSAALEETSNGVLSVSQPNVALDELIANSLIPAALVAADGLLRISGSDGPLSSMPQAAQWMDTEPGELVDYRAGLQLMLLALRLQGKLSMNREHSLTNPSSTKLHVFIDQAITTLCAASRVAGHLSDQSEAAREACFAERPMYLAMAAFALAQELPSALKESGWHALISTLLSLQQLGLIPAPSAQPLAVPLRGDVGQGVDHSRREGVSSVASGGHPQAGHGAQHTDGGPFLGIHPDVAAIDRAAALIAETLSSAASPSPLEPLWMRQRSCASGLELVRPSALLSCASSLTPTSLSALLAALLRVVDECVLLSLQNPLAGSLPAASALQLLGEALSHATGAKAIPAATAAAIDRCQRVLVTPSCPPPVQHAARHTLALLLPNAASSPGHQAQSQAYNPPRQPINPRRLSPPSRYQQQGGAPWQQQR